MEKRRTAFQLLFALGLIAPLAAAACEPAVKGVQVESARYTLAYRLSEGAGSRHFTVEVGACAKNGPPPETLKIDAQMPEHRHGMNYRPEVKRVASGHWSAEGLMFHMPGKWELVFELDGERLASEMVVFSQDEK